jgi:putative Mg2+ transporter-C (MgtC) family protein
LKAVLDLLVAALSSLTSTVMHLVVDGSAAAMDWFWAAFGEELVILDEHSVFMKLTVATFCGALLGLEREYADKPAGLRTNIFICVGSALFTLASIIAWEMFTGASPPSDPMRVAAQVVTGVGFLGAGVIFKSEERITGITTASTIWFVAAIGMMIAIGFPLLGFLISLAATGLLFALGRAEVLFSFLPKEDPPE